MARLGEKIMEFYGAFYHCFSIGLLILFQHDFFAMDKWIEPATKNYTETYLESFVSKPIRSIQTNDNVLHVTFVKENTESPFKQIMLYCYNNVSDENDTIAEPIYFCPIFGNYYLTDLNDLSKLYKIFDAADNGNIETIKKYTQGILKISPNFEWIDKRIQYLLLTLNSASNSTVSALTELRMVQHLSSDSSLQLATKHANKTNTFNWTVMDHALYHKQLPFIKEIYAIKENHPSNLADLQDARHQLSDINQSLEQRLADTKTVIEEQQNAAIPMFSPEKQVVPKLEHLAHQYPHALCYNAIDGQTIINTFKKWHLINSFYTEVIAQLNRLLENNFLQDIPPESSQLACLFKQIVAHNKEDSYYLLPTLLRCILNYQTNPEHKHNYDDIITAAISAPATKNILKNMCLLQPKLFNKSIKTVWQTIALRNYLKTLLKHSSINENNHNRWLSIPEPIFNAIIAYWQPELPFIKGMLP